MAYRELLDGVPKDSVRGTNWYDRNPKNISSVSSIFEWVPHVWLTRTSYTCPEDRIAMIEVMYISIMRLTAATTAGKASCEISWFDYNEDVWKYISRIEILDNTVGAREQWGLGSSATFYAGDMFEIQTQDVSTAGTCAYVCNWKGTEFDV